MRAEKQKKRAVPPARLILCHNALGGARICHWGRRAPETKGPRERAFSEKSQQPSAATVMPAMVAAARGEFDRLQLEACDAGRDVQPGLALHAERLQRVGVGGTANQEVAAAADADRGNGADAAIAAGEFAAPEPGVRRTDGPSQLGLLGDAELSTDALHLGDVGLRPAACAAEHAFETRHRADDEADILATLALQDTGANRWRRVGACDRRDQSQRGDS